ncbi:MAG TPA: 5-dehydro-2-deoxygluconokinase [Burkholderiales bacterium]
MTEPRLDLVCMGRAAVDLYGEQVGARLEDQSSFAKYLGGCPANIAVGASRLSLKAAMLTRVGDEHNGRFVRETLAAEGVDVSHVKTDPQRLTALVFLAIRDRDTFPLIFYRHECADMAIAAEDFDAAYIGSARALLVSGTHFSQPGIAAVCMSAIRQARRFVFDIDYRPVLWGLTSPGMGEQRFVASQHVTRKLQEVIPLAHLVIGTEEEFHIAGGCEDTDEALRRLRQLSQAVFVVKRGPLGCTVHAGGAALRGEGFPVEVFNVLGAGDGFAAGFLSGWLRDLPLEECARRANACGALVVSRHGCAPSMPSQVELELFLSRKDWPFRLRESRELEHVHRATTGRRPWPQVLALAFDHRSQLEELGPPERIRRFKRLVAEGLVQARVQGAGAIVDDRYGEEALFALGGGEVWVARPVEVPGSRPLEFEAGANVGVRLRAWPAQHVVKCLVHYERQDLPRLRQLHEACVDTGHELLLELLQRNPPLAEIYAAGVKPDWWKLAPPATEEEWRAIAGAIARHDPHCRGVLLLGMEASEAELERGFALAARHPVCKGFAVGRSIFMDAARRWFRDACSDAQVVDEVATNYARLAGLWRIQRTQCKESVSSASA